MNHNVVRGNGGPGAGIVVGNALVLHGHCAMGVATEDAFRSSAFGACDGVFSHLFGKA